VFFGERESGQDVRQSNVTAVQAVANIVKSSLGPVGLDKVLELKFCFREGKSQRWHRDGSFFSLSLSLLKALRRARRLAEVLYLCIKLTSSFLF
jgi:hypothetical protein